MHGTRYILVLLAFIGSCFGYIYLKSDVQTVKIQDKFIGSGTTRRGFSTESYVIQTSRGKMKLLRLPLIGYSLNAEDAFNRLSVGATVKVRIGWWPPSWFGQQPKPHIMHIYQ